MDARPRQSRGRVTVLLLCSAARRAPRTCPPVAGGRRPPKADDGGAVSRGLAGPPGPASLGRAAGRAAAAEGRMRGPLAAPYNCAMRARRRTFYKGLSSRAEGEEARPTS